MCLYVIKKGRKPRGSSVLSLWRCNLEKIVYGGVNLSFPLLIANALELRASYIKLF